MSKFDQLHFSDMLGGKACQGTPVHVVKTVIHSIAYWLEFFFRSNRTVICSRHILNYHN